MFGYTELTLSLLVIVLSTFLVFGHFKRVELLTLFVNNLLIHSEHVDLVHRI